MKIKFAILALMIGTSVTVMGQTDNLEATTKSQMRSEMQAIVNGLKLQPEQIQQIGELLEQVRAKKEQALIQISNAKKSLEQVDKISDEQIKALLTPSEWEKYQSEIKPQIEKIRKEELEKILD